jgi:AcrR family transcriptional regulator
MVSDRERFEDGEAREGPILTVPHSSEKILESAESLFAASGYSGVGMRQLAVAVGLSKSSLFHHFPTKRELYAAVLDRALERMEEGLVPECEDGADPSTRLDRWIASIVGVLAEDAPMARLMMRALVDEEPFPALALDGSGREPMAFEVRLARILDRFRALLEAGIADGSFRPVSIGDAIQSTIGALVFHFASGDLGEALIGEPIFSRAAVSRRRREVSEFIRRGLVA